jgi:ferredoxin
MKTHSMTLYTGAVKNLFGTVPGLYKSELHKEFPNPKHFADVLTTIYNLLKDKIALNIIDGIVGMEGAGPSAGTPYPFKVLIASEIASAADYVATKMMGFEFEKIVYLKQSLEDDGLREEDIEIATACTQEAKQGKLRNDKLFRCENVNISSVTFRNKILQNMPAFVKTILEKVFVYYPTFTAGCSLCKVCVNSCPVKALRIEDRKIILDKKGCIRCLCCHEMCPESNVHLKRRLLARIIFH